MKRILLLILVTTLCAGTACAAKLIGEKRASETAIRHANISAGDVRSMKTELKSDAAAPYYLVSFSSANMDYRCSVNAETAEVNDLSMRPVK